MTAFEEWEAEVLARPLPKWTIDKDGDHCLSTSSGRTAWISKAQSGRNQPPWYGRVELLNGSSQPIRGWTLKAAKDAAEIKMGLK
jgi:hypothetical protein